MKAFEKYKYPDSYDIEALNALIAKDPNIAQVWVARARYSMRHKNYVAAVCDYTAALTLYRSPWGVRVDFTQSDSTAEYIRLCRECDVRRALLQEERGDAFWMAKAYGFAAFDYTQAVSIVPDRRRIWTKRHKACEKDGDFSSYKVHIFNDDLTLWKFQIGENAECLTNTVNYAKGKFFAPKIFDGRDAADYIKNCLPEYKRLLKSEKGILKEITPE